MAMCIDTKEIFIWDREEGWIPVNVENKGIEFNLYDLNKNVINQLNPLTLEEIKIKTNSLNDYREALNNTYYMMLCKDFNYYTIFSFSVKPSFETFSDAVLTIITELGDVYSIEWLDNGSVEIWIKPIGEETPYAFYLFPYDAGVVYYG